VPAGRKSGGHSASRAACAGGVCHCPAIEQCHRVSCARGRLSRQPQAAVCLRGAASPRCRPLIRGPQGSGFRTSRMVSLSIKRSGAACQMWSSPSYDGASPRPTTSVLCHSVMHVVLALPQAKGLATILSYGFPKGRRSRPSSGLQLLIAQRPQESL
jgi:hypothetical protein